MTGPEHNPRDDEQDEEELFVLVIAELVQAGKISMAKIRLRSYIDYVNKSIAYGRESERAGKERGMKASKPKECEDCGEEVTTSRLRCRDCGKLVCDWCAGHVHRTSGPGRSDE